MTSTFTVGALALNGDGPQNYGEFALKDLTGWFSPVDSDGAMTERAAANLTGKHEYLPPRVFAVRGFYLTTTRPLARAAMAQLAALRQATLVRAAYSEDGEETSRRAVVVGIETTYKPTTTSFDFAIDFVAPDPRRYGPEVWTPHVSGSSVTVTNMGTAPSPLSLRLTRSGDTQTVTVPGAASTFTRGLSDGSLLWMDGERMETYLDGSRAAGMRAIRWPTVPPRSTVSVSVTGASAWSVGVRDAWW